MTLHVPEFLSPTKIVPKEALDTITDVQAYEYAMRQQLQRIEEHCEELKRNAEQEGYDQGVELGRKDAFAAMAESLTEVREHFLAMENELSEIVFTAVEKIIGTFDQRDLARRMISQALLQMADQVAVTIHVAPEDHATMHEDLLQIQQHITTPHILGLNIDPLLQPGEIWVETSQGRVHIGLAHQLARLRANLGA